MTEHGENCKEVFEMLSQYLDAELDGVACGEIEQHLAGCPPCIEFLNSLRRSIRLCHDCESAETPPPLSASERDQLRQAYLKAMKK
jgi:RNA polymerase sigma-70 factor (ECF subfamily)